MNHAMLQRIVEEVAARLRRRALSTATLSVAQLGEADIRSLLCQHASLRIVQVDLPLLEQLAGQRALAAAGCALHEAMAWGVRVQLTLLPALLPALAVKKLARLPLTFSDWLLYTSDAAEALLCVDLGAPSTTKQKQKKQNKTT